VIDFWGRVRGFVDVPVIPTPKTAKLFVNGGSQAVRLPVEFRFEESDEVYIRRDAVTGDVILSPRPVSHAWADSFAFAAGFPLSTRLLREMHGILLADGRGAQKQPGEFRLSQNWIGGTRPVNAAFVPPPPTHLAAGLTNLEQYMHEPANPVVKAALAHVQFETIHPFLDGNGRVGRLLITLMFCHDNVLSKPLLYPSLYFKQHRQQYYEELNAVRAGGDYERWKRCCRRSQSPRWRHCERRRASQHRPSIHCFASWSRAGSLKSPPAVPEIVCTSTDGT
jgi:virulence-associated protein VagC